ncbi:uncharacterized protein LOC119613675 isoform X2 [Lucilia sericata]|uniref:uncharacterized protein LOC119613675 isoform X2 n=1 Tax=Lucilia sericata TaxID=13632 RepID=UPI0018A87BF3|nr:uncharacterized protein LOC119613675 isoform X2 [Lucilia sericata]
MLRFLTKNLNQKWPKTFSSNIQYRNFNEKTSIVIGGGLEKPQGGLKEEKYFCNQNLDLMAKLRQQGTKLKCEDVLNDWKEFEKVLGTTNESKALRESCSLNKHKNCLEEAFFLNEQNECCTKLLKENKIIKQTNLKSATKKLQEFNENADVMDSNM